ncbi:MAG TPA: DegV family protein [Anaerolineales bacterium]|nr:DegV family protein [Anaerolineales bacterium]
MTLGIVTDSTCDLPASLIEEHGLEVVPCVVIIDGREYIDGLGISREEFYTRLPGFQQAATTSAPSLGEFAARYQKLLDDGHEHILSIHAAGPLTSMVSTAQQAAAEFGGRVTVVDSGSLSLGLGFQVLAAAQAAEHGLEAAQAAAASTRGRLHVFAALDTLEYVRRSGRVPAALTLLGSLLSIKPLIELIDGEVKILSAARTAKQANERLFSLMRDEGLLEQLAILHTNADKRAHGFLQNAMMEMSGSIPRDILLVNVTPVIGTHIGPNGLGYAAIRAQTSGGSGKTSITQGLL